jgi:hypothetical protein
MLTRICIVAPNDCFIPMWWWSCSNFALQRSELREEKDLSTLVYLLSMVYMCHKLSIDSFF